MTIEQIVSTFIGAFMFPFTIRMLWDTFVNKYDLMGGFLASLFIVGLIWAANHGIENPFMFQTGAWVDMGLAAGVGVWVATVTKGGNIKKSIPNILAAIIAGVLAGFILSLFL